jgi:hypothetical protein
MANVAKTGIGDWLVRVAGAPTDLRRIAGELGEGDPCVAAQGDSLYLKSSEVNKAELQVVAEWEAFELIRLLSAAAYLDFGTPISLRMVSVERAGLVLQGCCSVTAPSFDLPTLRQIIGLAVNRSQVRRAVLAHAVGGAGGFFEAYEAISSEALNLGLPEQATHVGVKEWFVRQGWMTHGDGDRFLNTVLHFRHAKERKISFEPIPPGQAEVILYGVLTNFIRHCIRLKIPMPVSDQRGECC